MAFKANYQNYARGVLDVSDLVPFGYESRNLSTFLFALVFQIGQTLG